MKKLVLLASLTCTLLGSTFAQSSKVLNAFEQSYEYEQDGTYEDAINVLRAVYGSGSYELNLRLGWLYYLAQQHQESIKYYQKAIDEKPSSLEARFGYVYPASVMENWNKVMEQYKAILKIDPQNTYANYRLGYMYYLREDYDNAKRYTEKVVKLYPFDFDSVNLLGWIYLKTGNNTQAKTLLNRALMISPGNASASEGLNLLKG